ncbi:extensin [Altererythrobacter xixiisoli]|uniref:Extensin n=1 Tax=Croceibacterium xixiisoli TaxID=1476466 RepID=A0A6I4TTT0_9SPHN|nr:extensin family protein [Croceibacterium xixiisoli]MXO99272.1 extensin [Croceibacterium xixiisoli]
MRGYATLALLAALLSACSIPEAKSGGGRSGGGGPSSSASGPPIAVNPQARQCLANLGQMGASFTPLPDRYISQGCTNLGTVQLTALAADNGQLMIGNLGPVTCDVTSAFAGWARFGADRAARQILGSPLRSIETMGSYNCRNVAGSGRRSAHATAAAIDISAFVLEDGRRITVRNHWNNGSSDERRFLRTVQESACKRFATVLGPGYNAAHHDHFHVEGVMGTKSFCR